MDVRSDRLLDCWLAIPLNQTLDDDGMLVRKKDLDREFNGAQLEVSTGEQEGPDDGAKVDSIVGRHWKQQLVDHWSLSEIWIYTGISHISIYRHGLLLWHENLGRYTTLVARATLVLSAKVVEECIQNVRWFSQKQRECKNLTKKKAST